MNGHLQTLYYELRHWKLTLDDLYPCERTLVKLEDGGQISVDWVCCPKVDKDFNVKTPVVVIFPGLTGDRHCGYVKTIIKEACSRKYKCVVMNHRGCSHTPLTSRK